MHEYRGNCKALNCGKRSGEGERRRVKNQLGVEDILQKGLLVNGSNATERKEGGKGGRGIGLNVPITIVTDIICIV